MCLLCVHNPTLLIVTTLLAWTFPGAVWVDAANSLIPESCSEACGEQVELDDLEDVEAVTAHDNSIAGPGAFEGRLELHDHSSLSASARRCYSRGPPVPSQPPRA